MIVRSKIIKMAMIKLKFVMKMENFSLIKMGTNTTRSKTQILQRKKRDKLETCTKYYKMHLSSLKYYIQCRELNQKLFKYFTEQMVFRRFHSINNFHFYGDNGY